MLMLNNVKVNRNKGSFTHAQRDGIPKSEKKKKVKVNVKLNNVKLNNVK